MSGSAVGAAARSAVPDARVLLRPGRVRGTASVVAAADPRGSLVCHIRSVVNPESDTVYLASPLGFTAAGRYWYEHVLLPAVHERGLIPLDPWTNGELLAHALSLPPGVGRELSLRTASREVAARNFEMIRRSASMLAVLDGNDVDSGTATEMGYAFALGVPVYALRTDTRQTGEHELSHVNLQVEECVYASGGIIGVEVDPVLDAIAAHLGTRDGLPPSATDTEERATDSEATTSALRSLLQSMPHAGETDATNSDATNPPAAPSALAPDTDAQVPSSIAEPLTPASAPHRASPQPQPQRLGRFTRVREH